MASKRRIHYFCIDILKSIRFRPTGSRRESYYSGIQSQFLGLGGLGVSYWFSHDVVNVEQNIDLIRELCKQKELSLEECRDVVRAFVKERLHPRIAGEFLLQISGTDLFKHLDDHSISLIVSEAISFFPKYFATSDFWIPLSSIMSVAYEGRNFRITPSLENAWPLANTHRDIINIPALKGASIWLCVKARSTTDATQKASMILGAFFLCMHHNTHFSHTGGEPTQGMLYYNGAMTLLSSGPHLPYLSNPIEIQQADFAWLNSVDEALEKPMEKRKFRRALRWLHSSWFSVGAERFSLLCMAVDAIVPSNLESSRAKCQWIKDNLGVDVDLEAISMIFKRMRSDVLHGDAPSLIESQAYLDFIKKYGEDPSTSAAAIVCKTIRNVHLSNVRIQPHPISKRPNYIKTQKEIMARYGLPFEVSHGYDFEKINVDNKVL